MCLICVEFNKKRMTQNELRKALPEMIMFAKTEEEREHFRNLQSLSDQSNDDGLEDFTKKYVTEYAKKNHRS